MLVISLKNTQMGHYDPLDKFLKKSYNKNMTRRCGMKLVFNLGKYFLYCYYHNINPNEQYFHLDGEDVENIIYDIEPEWCSKPKMAICSICGEKIKA